MLLAVAEMDRKIIVERTAQKSFETASYIVHTLVEGSVPSRPHG